MLKITVKNHNHPLRQILQAGYCNTFFLRFRGFMLRRKVGENSGLILVQTSESRMDSAIHMFFVNFDLAVIWLDKNRKVVDTCLAKRWRPFYMPSQAAQYILETHPQRLNEFQIGDQLSFETD
ncbi:MAG: DUF192 domain-containing protein [Chloroflexi bacterium]|nr:DUF192 domain-containing protein [Chloroflexota bacterium]